MTKILKEFNLDFSDLPQTSVIRNFTIVGDDNAEFILEITRGDGKYYNFTQRTWQSTKTFLETKIKGKNYIGQIKFSANTSSGDQYDISFWAKVGTEHADYDEVRFPDNSVDINSSVGSNSLSSSITPSLSLSLRYGSAFNPFGLSPSPSKSTSA